MAKTKSVTAHSFMSGVLESLYRQRRMRVDVPLILEYLAFFSIAAGVNAWLWLEFTVVEGGLHPLASIAVIAGRVVAVLFFSAVVSTIADVNVFRTEREERSAVFWNKEYQDLHTLGLVSDLLPDTVLAKLRATVDDRPLTRRDVRDVLLDNLETVVGGLHQRQHAILNRGVKNG